MNHQCEGLRHSDVTPEASYKKRRRQITGLLPAMAGLTAIGPLKNALAARTAAVEQGAHSQLSIQPSERTALSERMSDWEEVAGYVLFHEFGEKSEEVLWCHHLSLRLRSRDH